MTLDTLETTIETYRICSESDVMSAAISVYTLAKGDHFSDAAVSEVSTSVSELAMNIVKYADEGSIVVSSIDGPHRSGLKVVATDNGPGIENISDALTEKFSTGSSLGLGLPGVQRMVDEFDIESESGKGTKVTIIKWKT